MIKCLCCQKEIKEDACCKQCDYCHIWCDFSNCESKWYHGCLDPSVNE